MARSETHGACTAHQIYGLDCAEYDLLRARAAGHCEICSGHEDDVVQQQLYIDHAGAYYRRARVRGLLCCPCNTGLGDGMNRDLTPDQDRYLDNTFWRWPPFLALRAEREAAEAVLESALAAVVEMSGRRRRGERVTPKERDAVAAALAAGVRQRDILKATRLSQGWLQTFAAELRSEAS